MPQGRGCRGKGWCEELFEVGPGREAKFGMYINTIKGKEMHFLLFVNLSVNGNLLCRH